MAFKPKVHTIEVEDGGEKAAFYVREPSGREILEAAKIERKDRPAIENANELFSKYVVHQDGSAISSEEVGDILDMRLSAMQKLSDAVMEKIGLKKAEEPKNA